MKRMRRTQVVEEGISGDLEVAFGFFIVFKSEVGSDHYAVEPQSFGMERHNTGDSFFRVANSDVSMAIL